MIYDINVIYDIYVRKGNRIGNPCLKSRTRLFAFQFVLMPLQSFLLTPPYQIYFILNTSFIITFSQKIVS